VRSSSPARQSAPRGFSHADDNGIAGDPEEWGHGAGREARTGERWERAVQQAGRGWWGVTIYSAAGGAVKSMAFESPATE